MENIDIRQIIVTKNRTFNKPSIERQNIRQLMLFVSIDIVESTRLKQKYMNEWPNIINILLSQKLFGMQFWKFNGDEVLYKRNIASIDYICRIIERLYQHMGVIEELISQTTSINEKISVKSTIWLATTDNNVNEYKYNFQLNTENESIDYVGKNIDEGFRLTKYTSIRKIAIDPKIVYILMRIYKRINAIDSDSLIVVDPLVDNIINGIKEEKHNINDMINSMLMRTHLMGYATFKGVWGNRPYPVFWYFYNANTDITYNEYFNGQHLWEHKDSIKVILDNIDIYIDELRTVFTQVNINDEIMDICKQLSLFKPVPLSPVGKANLYYMVACIEPQSHTVMIAQRSAKRVHLKNVWDFGNVKYQKLTIRDVIESEYKNTFGIDISVVADPDRDNNVKPYGCCTIYRNCSPHNGILCFAVIRHNNSAEDLEKEINAYVSARDKYSKVKFVTAEDVANFSELTLDEIRIDSQEAKYNENRVFDDNKCIMYFQNSIKSALSEFDREKGFSHYINLDTSNA